MKNEERLLTVIDRAVRHARLIYYFYIGIILFIGVTALSVKDKELALGGSFVKLPLLNITAPLSGFFVVSAILATILFVNLLLYQNKIRVLVTGLLKNYRERNITYSKDNLFPWAMNTYSVPERGAYGLVQYIFAGVTFWFTLPAILFVLSYVFVRKHDELLSYIIVGLAFASFLILFLFWNKFNKSKRSGDVRDLVVLFLVCGIIVAGWYATCIVVPGINQGRYEWANLNLKNQILAIAPEGDKGHNQYYLVDLEGANLNGADLRNTVIKQSNLNGAKLNNAKLSNSDLSNASLAGAILNNADLKQAYLQGADLSYADLRGANLKNARLEEVNLFKANLKRADMEQANLRDTDLEGADLGEANLKNANLMRADLYKASLADAYMESANLDDSNLSLANLRRADLSRAQLKGAELKHSNLNKARLVEADLNASSFDSAQLRFADLTGANLTDAKLNSANLEGASLTNATLNGAVLLGVAFQGASFQNTELDQTFLYQADLRNTEGLTKEKLCGTGTLWEAQLDSDMLVEITDISTGCPEKLTKESYEKWQEARVMPEEFIEEG